MNLFWSFIISLLIIWAQGCGSQQKTSKDNETKQHRITDTSTVKSDTMPKPTPPLPGLPPGHAKVKAKILSIDNVDKDNLNGIMMIKVTDILGYGSSTPPLAKGDSVRITSKNLQQNDIQIGKFVTAVLSYQLMLNESGSSSVWALVKFEKDSN